jgi:RNA polymerase sigma factor (sigma-70 family)
MATDEPFQRLLAAAQANGAWAFEALYRELAPAVAGYLRMQGADEPDDLVSEVFIGVFRGLASFEGTEAQFRSWVFTIAHRRLTDERRRRGRRPAEASLDAVAEPLGGDVEEEALAGLGGERVRALLADLSPEQRDVILLRVVADLSVEDVAQALGKRPGAIKALQRRGLAALHRKISREAVTR